MIKTIAWRLSLILLVGCLGWLVCPSQARADDGNNLGIVVGPDAPRLEQFAADQLGDYLGKLFGLEVRPTSGLPASTGIGLLVGTPETNPAVAKALGVGGWPKLSDQGIVLKRGALAGKQVLVVGGGSPVATMWAVYELVERWGVRYLVDGDIYPPNAAWSGLPDLDLVMEPNMPIRCWRLVNEFPLGPVSWSLEENVRFLQQIAKMKYNRIHTFLWPHQPFVHYTFRGMPKPPGILYFGQRHPIDDDTIGREKFPGMTVFTNPELVGAESPADLHRRAVALVQGIHQEARRLGMQTVASFEIFNWPKEFQKLIPAAQPSRQLGDLYIQPGNDQPLTDPLLAEIVETVVRTHIETYPDVDFIQVSVPEKRIWVSQGREAYRLLDERYDLASLGSYDELCARGRSRANFPGGGARVESQVQGDLAFLWMFDSLIRDGNLLQRPGGGKDVKLIYDGVTFELFPLVARITPPGGEVVNFIDYTASRVLRHRDLIQTVPSKDVPVSLIMTLADDNVGVLPQMATGSIHELMADMRASGWDGFYTRYWTVGEQDPTIHYLARASWDASLTPQEAYTDQVERVCGPKAVAPVLEAFALIEKITLNLDQHGLGFGFPVPTMMTKHYDSGGLSAAIKEDHRLYHEALAQMEAAREHCRPEGRAYIDYFVARLRFAVRYLDAAEAYGATSLAEKAYRPHEARQQASLAYRAIREALEEYVAVAKDHGDLGAVAMMNEYCYRPIRDKRNQLEGASERPNIVFVYTDDQAPTAVGNEGNEQIQTPHIDRLFRAGARLTRAFVTTPVCSPSRASLMTSRYGSELGIFDWINPRSEPEHGLDPNTVTWSEVLANAGYATGLVGKWHLGTADRYHPTKTGYQYFMGFRSGGNSPENPTLELNGATRTFVGFTPDILTDHAIDFVRRNKHHPFLLSLHFRAPHAPWLPVRDEDWDPYKHLDPEIPNPDYPNLDVATVKRRTREYMASVSSVDRNLGRLLDVIDELQLQDNTVVIFTSDHGYNTGHNGVWHKGNAKWILTRLPPQQWPNIPPQQRPNLYDQALRVPAAVRWPRVIKPDTVIEQTVTNLDWYPTLLAMAGVDLPEDVLIRGHNFLPLLAGEPIEWDNDMYCQYSMKHGATTQMCAVRTPQWKLMIDFKNPGREELYDLEHDPGEQSDLSDSSDPHVRRVKEQLRERILNKMREIDGPVREKVGKTE